ISVFVYPSTQCLYLFLLFLYFFFTATAPTDIYTLSLHDALPIYAESDLVHQLPSTIAFFAHRILLRLCGDCWSNVACGAWFRAWLTASCPDPPLGRFSESCVSS